MENRITQIKKSSLLIMVVLLTTITGIRAQTDTLWESFGHRYHFYQ